MLVGSTPIVVDDFPVLGKKEDSKVTSQKDKTITDIARLYIKSPFVWTFGSLAVSWFALPATASVALTAVVVCSMAAFPHQMPRSLHYEAAIVDCIGRDFLTRAGAINQPYCSEISPGIVLGALPLKGFYDVDTLIKKYHLKAVVMVVEDYELNTDTFISTPIRKQEWLDKGIKVLHLKVKDMTQVSMKDLHKAADFIKKNKEGVYIHCKAGRGRSVMCLMAYLMKHEGKSYKEALELVTLKRSTASLKSWQKDKLKEFEEEIKNRRITRSTSDTHTIRK